MEIEKIDGEIGEVTLRGKVLTCENRELRSGKFILTFDVSDFTDTITVKMFIRPEIFDEVKSAINPGMFIKVKGVTTIDKFDGELTLGSIVGIKKADDFTSKRMDSSLEKRVELHCHTKMSDMDGVSEVKASLRGPSSGACPLWLSRTMAASRPSRMPTTPWTRGIPLKSSTGWRGTWWMIPNSW